MKVLMLVVFFILLGGFYIIAENNIALNSGENVEVFVVKYFDWVGSLINNGKVVSGYVVKMEWLPGGG